MSMDSHKRDFSANARLPGIFALAACIGVVSTFAAFVLLNLIHLFTNLFFFGTLSAPAQPAPVPSGARHTAQRRRGGGRLAGSVSVGL
jgi:hypothetical protein